MRPERTEHATRATVGRRTAATWLLGGSAAQALLAFAANLVLVRCIAPEGFGRFALAFAAVTAVLSLLTLRTGALIVRAPRDDDDTRRLFVSALLAESVAAGSIAALVLVLGGAADGWSALLLAACLVKHTATNARGFLERHGAWRRLALLEGGAQLASHAVAVVLALAGLGVGALVLRELALGASSLALLVAAGGWPRVRPRWVRLAEWRALAREARDLWVDGALEGLFARALVLAAGLVGGERGAGLFAQAHRLAVVPHQFLSPIAGRLAYAWFARAGDKRALRRRLTAWLALPLAVAAAGAVLLADRVVPLVFGAAWSEAAPLVSALAGVVLGTSLLALVKMQLQSERALRALLATRAVQFAGLGLGVAAALAVAGDAPLARGLALVGLGVSAGTLAAFATGWRVLARRERAAPPVALTEPPLRAAA